MSKLEEIKENWAKGQGFDSWEIMRQEQGIDELDLDIICKEYAIICVKASLEKASEDAKIIHKDLGWYNKSCVKKESITNPDNIVLL